MTNLSLQESILISVLLYLVDNWNIIKLRSKNIIIGVVFIKFIIVDFYWNSIDNILTLKFDNLAIHFHYNIKIDTIRYESEYKVQASWSIVFTTPPRGTNDASGSGSPDYTVTTVTRH